MIGAGIGGRGLGRALKTLAEGGAIRQSIRVASHKNLHELQADPGVLVSMLGKTTFLAGLFAFWASGS